MVFLLLKVILFLVLPPSSLIIIMTLGMLLLKRYPRGAKIIMIGGVCALYLLSIRPVSDALIKPLEAGFKPAQASLINSAHAVVILTGGAADLSWVGIGLKPSMASLARLVHGITLYKHITGARLILSGGSGDPQKPNISEADAMKDMAVALGVPAVDIVVENKSGNTIENVKALKGFIGGGEIILVTSAYHMKRAAAMFRKMGIEVIPAPTDYISEQKSISFYSLIPNAGSFMASSVALYEYIALTWYGIRGET